MQIQLEKGRVPIQVRGEVSILGLPNSGVLTSFVASQDLDAYTVVYIENGKLWIASADDLAQVEKQFVMVLKDVQSGGLASVIVEGQVVNPDWDWDVSKSIYLGMGGELTQEFDSALFLNRIATPLSPKVIYIKPDKSIVL